ncbi:hypothetical protein JZU54_04525, partial [bacterium]|nr:hypothetical protein [bacterium]
MQSDPAFSWGWVSGNGTLGTVSSSVNPGRSDGISEGIINTGNLTLTNAGASMYFRGSTAGTGYGQINVTGTVTLGNSSLYTYLENSFIPSLNQEFVLIRNDGTDAVSGTFQDKPEGTILTLNGYQFRLSYQGGDGNDVTLTSTMVAKSWTGTVSGLWSNAGNWSPNGVPANGDL